MDNIREKMKEEATDVIECLKAKPSVVYPPFIDEAYTKLTHTDFIRFRHEEERYVSDFNLKYNRNPHNPCTEYSEFYEGLNKIRKRYGLNEIHPIGCPMEDGK